MRLVRAYWRRELLHHFHALACALRTLLLMHACTRSLRASVQGRGFGTFIHLRVREDEGRAFLIRSVRITQQNGVAGTKKSVQEEGAKGAKASPPS